MSKTPLTDHYTKRLRNLCDDEFVPIEFARKLERELAAVTEERDELKSKYQTQCNEPDHGAINAERAESRGLRKAWVELDDKRQDLEKQLSTITEQRDKLAEVLNDLWHHYSLTGAAYELIEKALAAVKGGQQ
jgi:uncharacterized coiled-coil DUF342 family protein